MVLTLRLFGLDLTSVLPGFVREVNRILCRYHANVSNRLQARDSSPEMDFEQDIHVGLGLFKILAQRQRVQFEHQIVALNNCRIINA